MIFQRLFKRKDDIDKILEGLPQSNTVDIGRKLADLGPPAVGRLIDKLSAATGDERESIIFALQFIADPTALPVFIGLLVDPDDGVRCRVASGLSDFSDQRAIEPLVAALERNGEIFAARRYAAKSLLKLGWTPSSPQQKLLLTVLSLDPGGGRVLPFRSEGDVIENLRQYGDEVTPYLLMALSAKEGHASHAAREGASKALGELAGEEAIPMLTQVAATTRNADYNDMKVSQAAAMAVAMIQSRNASRMAGTFPSEDIPKKDLVAVSTSDLRPGAMIRIWHEYLDRWATDWIEVVSVTSDTVVIRKRSGELDSRTVRDSTQSAFRLP